MHLIFPSAEPYPGAPYQRDELLHELFAETAGRFPERIAVRLVEPNPESTRWAWAGATGWSSACRGALTSI